jgi:glycerol-3-phosphate dehydrogenase (NAD(P)+)
VIVAVPSGSLTANLDLLAPQLGTAATVVSAVKGIEVASGRRMSQVMAARGIGSDRIVVLSGPNFAGEIALGRPAATVVAGSDAARVAFVQTLLNGPAFRVYTSDDVVGVEIGGALKNVVAIACGMSDGLGFGENAKAALITRALAEITRLGVALGARPLTFLGLAGMGDLVSSCFSDLSRNRRLGLALGRGAGLDEALAGIDGTVEGALTARALPVLVRDSGVEMPICQALHAVLYEGLPVRQAVDALMSRAAKPEF